jgi:hypothetical protein
MLTAQFTRLKIGMLEVNFGATQVTKIQYISAAREFLSIKMSIKEQYCKVFVFNFASRGCTGNLNFGPVD